MEHNEFRLRASTLAYAGCNDFPERVQLIIRRGVPGTPWSAEYVHYSDAKKENGKYRFLAKDDLELIRELQRIIFIAIDTGPLITLNLFGCPPEIRNIIANIFELASMVYIEKRKSLAHSFFD